MISYVFVDMDNTIAENITCKDVEFCNGMYINKRPIQIVIDALNALYPKAQFIIISQVQGGAFGIKEKIEWLNKYFPNTSQSFFLHPGERKSDYIEWFLKINGIMNTQVLLVDDKKDILSSMSSLGISVKYPQQIICDYEELKRAS